MTRVLTAYFSASGVTARLAKRLAEAIRSDLYEIRPQIPYSKADLNWLNSKSRSSVEMKDRACRPKISGVIDHFEQYDVVFLGFPIWWYREPSIIDTFMESYDFSGKTVIPFATSGMSPIGESGRNMRRLAGSAKVLEGKRFSAAVSSEKLKAWAEQWICRTPHCAETENELRPADSFSF